MDDLGIRQIGSTVDTTFATFLKDQSARTAFSGGSVAWYAGNGTTPIAVGTTFTSPWSSNTGVHHVQTSMSTTNGFALDTTYVLRATAGTVDSTDMTGVPLASVRLVASLHDGAFWSGSVTSILPSAICFTAGHNIPTIGSAIVVLSSGTDAIAKSRYISYSGSGNTFIPNPAFDAVGEALPTGPITARVYPAPPPPSRVTVYPALDSVSTVDVRKVSNITLGTSGTGGQNIGAA